MAERTAPPGAEGTAWYLEEIQRLRAGLEKIREKSTQSSRSYTPREYRMDYRGGWHDGYTTALSTASLIAFEHLDPEGWDAHRDEMLTASYGSDREWFEKTGYCGHCGNEAQDCICTEADPCACGPHELRTEPVKCYTCKGSGQYLPRARALGVE